MSAPRTTDDVFAGMLRTLATPAHWTKGFEARDTEGLPVDACSPHATCWCLYGARAVELARVVDPELRARLDEETDELLHAAANGASPSAVNDDRSTTHADVLGLLAEAQSASASASRNA